MGGDLVRGRRGLGPGGVLRGRRLRSASRLWLPSWSTPPSSPSSLGEIWSVAHAGTNSLVGSRSHPRRHAAPPGGCGGGRRGRHLFGACSSTRKPSICGWSSSTRCPAVTSANARHRAELARRLRPRPGCLRLPVLRRGEDACSTGCPRWDSLDNVSVILRLRGRTTLGSTFLTVVSELRRPTAEERRPAVPDRPRPGRAQGLGIRVADQATHRRAPVSGDRRRGSLNPERVAGRERATRSERLMRRRFERRRHFNLIVTRFSSEPQAHGLHASA